MKKLLAIVISMAMLVAMMPMGVFAVDETSGETAPTDKNYVAQIGDKQYKSLKAAVESVTDNKQTKIELLDDVTDGDGIVVGSGKNIEFDLGEHTYTVTKNLAGSKGTESQCFQLLKDSKIKIYNGKIKANNNNVAMIIQNYSNLTLEDVVLDGESITRNDVTVYTLSNNNGEISINLGTVIKKANNPRAFAMDVCWAKAYENGARVTINEGAIINGPLELGLWDESTYADGKSVLTVNGGTFNGPIKLDSNTSETPAQVSKNVTIKGGTFSDLSALDYLGNDADIKIELKESVDLKDMVKIPSRSKVTLDLNGQTIKNNGNFPADSDAIIAVLNGAELIVNDSSKEKAGKIVTEGDTNVACGIKMSVKGEDAANCKLTVNGGIVEGASFGIAGNGTRHGSDIIINGGKIKGLMAIYHPQKGTLTINGGELTGNTALAMKSGTLTITGGDIKATGDKAEYIHNGNGFNSTGDALVVEACDYPGGVPLVVNISGGIFTSQNNKAVAYYKQSDEYKLENEKFITGGTFSTDPSAYVADGYVVRGSNPYVVEKYIPYTPSTPSTPATDNVTNNPTDKNTTADLAPAVKDNKAETTVDAKTADKIVEKALENKSEEIIVDAAGNNSVASSEVAIPEKTVKEIAEKTDANLVIKTDNGKVDLDKTALAAVAEQAGTTGTVRLVIETVKTDADICHVNLKLVTSNGAVTDFKGGNVKVTINLTKELAAKELVCVYIDDNGIYTLVEGVLNADGTYTFTTGHFSEYAVMAKAEADKKIAEQLDTMIKDVNLKVRTSKTAKKNIKAVVSGDVKAITDAGYTVKYKFYRSEKKASKYEAKATKAGKTYINTAGKKGTKYYYKAKALVYDGDKLVGQTVLKQCKYGVRTWSK